MMIIRVLSAIPYTHIVAILALLGSMAHAFSNQGIPVLFPFIQDQFDSTRAQLGLISSGLLLGGTGTAIFMGWLADRTGVRKVLPASMVLVAAGLLLFSQIQSVVHGVLIALFIGSVASASAPSTAKAIIDWVKPESRGVSMGIKETSVPISGIVTAGVLPSLALTFSWRTAAMVLAILVAISSAVFFVFYRDKPASRSEEKRSTLVGSIGLIAKNRNIWLADLSFGALTAVQVVFVSYLILFLKDDLDMSTAVAGAFLAIAWTGSIVGRVFWGMVSDMLGGRRVIVLVLVGILSVICMALMTWLPPNASQLVIGMLVFVVGITALGWPAVLGTLIVELAGPALAGTSIGFLAIVSRVSAFVPPLFGLVVDRTGSYEMGWWMMAGVAAIGTLLVALVRHQPRHL